MMLKVMRLPSGPQAEALAVLLRIGLVEMLIRLGDVILGVLLGEPLVVDRAIPCAAPPATARPARQRPSR